MSRRPSASQSLRPRIACCRQGPGSPAASARIQPVLRCSSPSRPSKNKPAFVATRSCPNNGRIPLHVAAANPQYFLSVTAFPGYMWEATEAKLEAISKMCIFMYVGEFDPYMWHDEMEGEAEYLRSLGAVAQYNVEKNQPHRLGTLSGANAGRLFDGFEEAQKGCGGK